jgi:hypothetical protein
MKTAKLLFWCGIAYGILLVFVRGVLPPESSPTLFLVGIPLVVIAVIIGHDLARRSTSPNIASIISTPSLLKEDPIQFLSGQIRVASSASDSYFENVVRARLKELLISKVALETGMERDIARHVLSDPKQGQKLLRTVELYTILYGPIPRTGSNKMTMIKDAIEMIGEWKG